MPTAKQSQRMATNRIALLCIGGVMAMLGVGCASHLKVAGTNGEILVSFSGARGQKIPVTSISVFEMEEGRRGRTVCDVNSPSLDRLVRLMWWQYGRRIPGYEMRVTCERLVPQKLYGVRVTTPAESALVTDFVVRPDGSVSDLGTDH